MHYIRFLKVPRIEVKKKLCTVKALITIATDLGDDFLAVDLKVFIFLVRRDDSSALERRECEWKAGMRALPVTIQDIPISSVKRPVTLVVGSCADIESSLLHLSMDGLRDILSVWSLPFTFDDDTHQREFARRAVTASGIVVGISESAEESIARHLWDGGILCCALLRDLARTNTDPTSTVLHKTIHSMASNPGRTNTIELGSGSGIVGLQLAHILGPQSTILLTDLALAKDILDSNIAKMKPPKQRGAVVERCALDWSDDELPPNVENTRYDLILVSDCTYNTNSIPALVETLNKLTDRSPLAVVVIATKVRHDSEVLFRKLLAKTRISEIEHTTYQLPDRQRTEFGQDLEVVDIYMYQRQNDT